MYLQGAKATGLKYGQASPLDYAGLKLWYRMPDGIAVNSRGFITQMKDLSGNNNMAMGSATSVAAYRSSSFGPCFDVGQTTPFFGSGFDYSFLVDGSPYSVILISDCIASSGLDPGFYLQDATAQGANGTPSYYLSMYPTPEVRAFSYKGVSSSNANRLLNVATQVSPALTITRTAYVPRILCDTCYGYGTATPNRNLYVNNSLFGSSSYLNAPTVPATVNTSTMRASFGGQINAGPTGVKPRYWELIIYNHTGKSKTKIDSEMNDLHEKYLRQHYPGIY